MQIPGVNPHRNSVKRLPFLGMTRKIKCPFGRNLAPIACLHGKAFVKDFAEKWEEFPAKCISHQKILERRAIGFS